MVLRVDVLARALRFARARLPGARLLLYGQSMGAAAVLRAAGEGAVAPDAVIVEGVFDSLLNTVRNRFASMGVPSFPNAELLVFWGGVRHGYDGFAHRPAEYVRTLRCPLLVMHGSEDKRVSVAEARRVFEAAPGRKAFKLFLGAGHESFVSRAPAEWREAVAPFLRAAGG
jgi:alpha-beta hydrolase superfamily lysophospholipase